MRSFIGRIAAGTVARLSLCVDVVVLLAAIASSASLSGEEAEASINAAFSMLAVIAWLVTALALRHYDPWASDRAPFDDAAMTSILVMAITTLLAIGRHLLGMTDLPTVGVFLLVAWPLLVLARFALFRTFSPHAGPIDEVLVLGVGALGRVTATDLQRRHRVLGFMRFSGDVVPDRLRPQVLGAAGELAQLLRTVPVGEVFIASTNPAHAAEVQSAVTTCERFGVPFALPAYTFRLERAKPKAAHAVIDGYLHYQTVSEKDAQLALKRAFDIVSSAIALWALLPLLLVVAFLVKVTSPGPVLFRQSRVGLNGKPFRMLKFRTMVVDAEARLAALAAQNEMDGPVFKIKKDPRITPIGRFLRKYSIDELPQLINVLRGDMSVVGPRPPLANEVARYEAWQRRRLSVRPGLTCIWQVSGRNEISFEQWMYLDLQYIDTWSFAKDVRLILKTVPIVLTGRGAS